MDLTVLGCDGSYPGPGGAGSGYLVRHGATSVWLDAGPGTLANLQRHIPIDKIDAVVVTHEHVDHWSDLEHLAVAARYVVRRPPVPLYCETDLTALMHVGDATASLAWIPIEETSVVDVGGLRFSFSRTDHPVSTLAVRVDGGGSSLGYSADSGPAWGLDHLGEGLDLALCEATFLSDREGTLAHMSARQAGLNARHARVRRLLITHLWPQVDRDAALHEATTAFGGPVGLAVTGETYRP